MQESEQRVRKLGLEVPTYCCLQELTAEYDPAC